MDYADGGESARTAFNRLGLFFNGRMLDDVTRLDIREYFKQRATGTGVYEGYKASIRSAEADQTFLRALYTYLQDCGFAIDSPCYRPQSRKKDSPLATYRPEHVKVTPGPDALAAIFTATKRAKPCPGYIRGRQLIREQHRVFFKLCYHTAARPESEPCRLRHGDVKFLTDGWAEVSYRFAKNVDSNRTIPIPSEVAEPLRGIMLDEPSRFDKEAWAAWAVTPIFRKRNGDPWGESSYARAWASVVSVVPGIEGMWLRDLRGTAKMWLRKSGIAEPVVRAFLGHRQTVHDGYDNVDASDLRAAAEALRTKKLAVLLSAESARDVAAQTETS